MLGPTQSLVSVSQPLFFNGVRGLWHGITTHLHLVLSLRMLKSCACYSAVYILSMHRDHFMFYLFNLMGTRLSSWLRHCVTSLKVAGLIPNGVGIFH